MLFGTRREQFRRVALNRATYQNLPSVSTISRFIGEGLSNTVAGSAIRSVGLTAGGVAIAGLANSVTERILGKRKRLPHIRGGTQRPLNPQVHRIMPMAPRRIRRGYRGSAPGKRRRRPGTMILTQRSGKDTLRVGSTNRCQIQERIPRGPRTQLFILKRTVQPALTGGVLNIGYLSYTNVGNADAIGVGWDFTLNQIGSYTDFTNHYQYYKILGVQLFLIPTQNTFPSITAAATQTVRANASDALASSATIEVSRCPRIILAADNTSSAGFASAASAFSHERSTTHYFNNANMMKTYLSPHVLRVAGVAGAEVEVHIPKKLWISTADAGEKHFGIRAWVEGLFSGSRIDVIVTYTVAFKDIKT